MRILALVTLIFIMGCAGGQSESNDRDTARQTETAAQTSPDQTDDAVQSGSTTQEPQAGEEAGSADHPTQDPSAGSIEEPEMTIPEAPTPVAEDLYTTAETGLKYYDLVEGEGESPKVGQMVTVNYAGWLTDGTRFDSSYGKGKPFSFPLGLGRVIPGWDIGVKDMKEGGKRQLVIPPHLGYGAKGAGGVIPPNATLIFEIELLGMK